MKGRLIGRFVPARWRREMGDPVLTEPTASLSACRLNCISYFECIYVYLILRCLKLLGTFYIVVKLDLSYLHL